MTVTSPHTHTGHEIAELLAENARLSEAVAGYHKLTEAQREQIERLYEALKGVIPFINPTFPTDWRKCDSALTVARAALSETEWPTSIREWADRQETK